MTVKQPEDLINLCLLGHLGPILHSRQYFCCPLSPVPFIHSMVFIDAGSIGNTMQVMIPDNIIFFSLRCSQTSGCKTLILRRSVLGTSNSMRDQHSYEFAAW